MSALLQPLLPPDTFEQSSFMWVDEAIWGHRLYDEQVPWFVFLEFLNVFTHENEKGRAFDEQGRPNELRLVTKSRSRVITITLLTCGTVT